MFKLFAFDLASQKIITHDRIDVDSVDAICEGPDGIVLSRANDATLISLHDRALVIQTLSLTCPSQKENPGSCAGGSTLFHGQLPGREEALAICYSSTSRATTFHVISQDGTAVNLGAAGTSPGGSGRFVVTRGVQPGTFLTHHTQSLVGESAVIVDLNFGTVAAFDMPDLTEARPSRGFGAGRFGVTVHPAMRVLIVEGEGGEVFLLRKEKTQKIAENAAAQSVRIINNGCGVALVTRTDEASQLRIYNVCNK